jgi:hypothetical protein
MPDARKDSIKERVGTWRLSWRLRRRVRGLYMQAVFVRSYLRKIVAGTPCIYVLGDSHVGLFLSGHPPWALFSRYRRSPEGRPYVVHWLGPATAYNLSNPMSTTMANKKVLNIMRYLVRKQDAVILIFGEIDCRAHIYNQYIKSSRTVSMLELIDRTIDRYGLMLQRLGSMGVDIYVASVAPGVKQGNLFNLPNDPPPDIRSWINRTFNERLSDFCNREGYRFIDVYSHVADEEGFIPACYGSSDRSHLNEKAIPFFEEGMARYTDRSA